MMNMNLNQTRQPNLQLYDGLQDYPSSGENFLIQGPVGVLEALTVVPPAHPIDDPLDQGQARSPIAVICHPHPLHGGTMSNKVVHIIATSFTDMGIPTLRFNFRGVGQSQGRFDHGRGEVDDLIAVTEWFKHHYPDAPLWLAGFSFGAFVAYQTQHRLDAERLLLIAPPINMYDFGEADPVTIPWMVMQGGKDDLVPAQEVSKWVHQQPNPPQFEWIADAGHFFHGRLNKIRDSVTEAWSEEMV